MTLQQTVRLHRKHAERQLKAIQRMGRWPKGVRRISLRCLREAFAMKPAQVRAMVDAGTPPQAVREYATSNVVICW